MICYQFNKIKDNIKKKILIRKLLFKKSFTINSFENKYKLVSNSHVLVLVLVASNANDSFFSSIK